MNNRILISVTPEETSMALCNNGLLYEYILERNNQEHIVGNIFKGRVKNILDGIQAAFIDVGRDKNVFLYNGDDIPLHEGQNLLVQVVKDAMGSKGPRAIAQISLPGRYIVFLPDVDYIGVSKKINSADERERLRLLVEKIKPEGVGIIVRTVAQNCSTEELQRDIQYLTGLWQSIKMRAQRTEKPSLLYREVDLPIRIVRDYLTDKIDEVVVDDKVAHQRICELQSFSYPEYKGKITYYDNKENIFKHYNVEQEISNLTSRKVPLKCGGYLIFDYTEALTVIDVNTGSFKGQGNLEETALYTNLEAVEEIARQLRLRDIGGIVIADFIDLNSQENRNKILEKLEQEVAGDKMKPRILGITALGLIEMTRKKARPSTNAALFNECPTCNGSGMVKSPESISVEIRRQLREIKNNRAILLQVHPTVAEWFINYELQQLTKDKQIRVQAVNTMHPEAFSLLETGDIDR